MEQEKDKRNQPETEEEKHDVGWSTATLICGGIEDLWEEFVMCKENEKEKKEEEPQKEAIVKEGVEKIRQLSMGKLRKRDAKGANRSLLPSGGLMADVPCLDHSLDDCKGYPDDVQTTKHAR